ncbi:DUF4328 domain-containing protein [Streptosporangium sp. NPDC002524]|uniref:DUF4328 domain-containing protein n=1 Tax=Streptosporangium sp. NPDC002524 TaxID=3154537 RepID=UPI00332D7421
MALTALVVAIAALAVFEQARGRRLVMEISRLGGDPNAPGADAVFGAVTVFAILIMFFAATAIAAVAAYLNWLLRARQGADLPAVAPVLVSWFVPVVNLVAPVVLADRLWWASGPPLDRRLRWTALLTAWWLSWLVAFALLLARLWPGASQGSTNLTGLGLTELVAVTVASLLCAATVRQITGIQAAGARHRRQAGAEHHLPPPPAEAVPHLLVRNTPLLSPAFPETSSRESSSRETSSRETTSRDASSREASSRETPSREVSSREAFSRETPARDSLSREALSRDGVSREAPSREALSPETLSPEMAERDRPQEVHPAGQ